MLLLTRLLLPFLPQLPAPAWSLYIATGLLFAAPLVRFFFRTTLEFSRPRSQLLAAAELPERYVALFLVTSDSTGVLVVDEPGMVDLDSLISGFGP